MRLKIEPMSYRRPSDVSLSQVLNKDCDIPQNYASFVNGNMESNAPKVKMHPKIISLLRYLVSSIFSHVITQPAQLPTPLGS